MRTAPRSRHPLAGALIGTVLAAVLLAPATPHACDPATWSAADSLAGPACRLLDEGTFPLQGAEAAALPQPGVGWSHLISVESNSYNPDCNPWVTWDHRRLFFITWDGLNGPARPGFQGEWDIYEAPWDSALGRWGTPVNVGSPINTPGPDRRPSATLTGDTLFFSRGANVWVSVRSGGVWGTPVQLLQGSDPCISSDLLQLYFVRNNDVWVADRGSTILEWLNARSVGAPVNTQYAEVRPFLSFDRQKLYFSDFGSSRPGGYGAADLWVSTWTGSAWGTPVNVGPAVNNDRNACTPYVSPSGRELYAASESYEGSRGDEDVWVSYLDSLPAPRTASGTSSLWTRCAELPGAWNVYDLAEGPGGVIYAATAPTGAVFRSKDGGNSWSATATLPGALAVHSLLVAQDGTIYAGCYPMGDVYRSANGGTSWELTANLTGATTVRALIETADGRILAGTSPGGIIFASSNGGTSWTQLPLLSALGSGVTSLIQTRNGYLYAGGWGPPYRSTDGGTTWTALTGFPFAPSEARSMDSFYQTRDSVLWATGWVHSHGGYLFRSTDAGASWDTTGRIMVGAVHAVRVYAMDEDEAGALRIGFQSGPDSVACLSDDRGATWRTESALPGAHEVFSFLRCSDGTLFAATTPNGDVFRWNGWVTGVPGPGRPGEPVLLSPAVPNPSRSSVTLAFRLPRAGRAVLTVVDPQGRRVRGLLDARLEAGEHTVSWDGRDDAGSKTAAGLFFLRVDFAGRSSVQKLVALR